MTLSVAHVPATDPAPADLPSWQDVLSLAFAGFYGCPQPLEALLDHLERRA